MLTIKLFVLFCKYFFKVSEGPSFALHKETGEGGHKNYIVQHKRNMEHYYAPQSACVWEGGGDIIVGGDIFEREGELVAPPLRGP